MEKIMNHRRKRIAITSSLALCLLGAVGMSKPGRMTFRRVLSVLASPSPDAAQRARTKHGWGARPIENSLVRGTLTYYDRNGLETRRFKIALYRKYPDQLRRELERDDGSGKKIVSGFDGRVAWRAGAT